MANSSIAPNLEGLDFIETEEDVKAVESAALKIQSTFRGKKIRSKVAPAAKSGHTQKGADPASQAGAASGQTQSGADSSKQQREQSTETIAKNSRSDSKVHQQPNTSKSASLDTSTTTTGQHSADEQLNRKLSAMQVNDNNKQAASATNQPALPEDEAERAATKIQAGFKGYKTRKELEGKLAGGQQMAPQAGATSGDSPGAK